MAMRPCWIVARLHCAVEFVLFGDAQHAHATGRGNASGLAPLVHLDGDSAATFRAGEPRGHAVVLPGGKRDRGKSTRAAQPLKVRRDARLLCFDTFIYEGVDAAHRGAAAAVKAECWSRFQGGEQAIGL